jgi:hypothetical protein
MSARDVQVVLGVDDGDGGDGVLAEPADEVSVERPWKGELWGSPGPEW